MLDKLRSKLPKIEITPSKFYKIGVWCFGIVAIANTAGFINALIALDNFSAANGLILISKSAGLVFNYTLFGFFFYLNKTSPPDNLQKGSLADMEALMYEKEVKTK